VIPTTSSSGTPSGMQGDGRAFGGRRFFYLNEEVNKFLNHFRVGFVFVFPFVVALFSWKLALVIVGIGVASYVVGKLIQEFTYWYNSRPPEITGIIKLPEEDRNPISPELEEVLERLHYFENKYFITICDMYRYLDRGEIPVQDNLDWIEMVSLLNRLSLNVGKYFKKDTQKGKDK
jgi:hypothetical protein